MADELGATLFRESRVTSQPGLAVHQTFSDGVWVESKVSLENPSRRSRGLEDLSLRNRFAVYARSLAATYPTALVGVHILQLFDFQRATSALKTGAEWNGHQMCGLDL